MTVFHKDNSTNINSNKVKPLRVPSTKPKIISADTELCRVSNNLSPYFANQILLEFVSVVLRIKTQGHIYARQASYHWTTLPASKYFIVFDGSLGFFFSSANKREKIRSKTGKGNDLKYPRKFIFQSLWHLLWLWLNRHGLVNLGPLLIALGLVNLTGGRGFHCSKVNLPETTPWGKGKSSGF